MLVIRTVDRYRTVAKMYLLVRLVIRSEVRLVTFLAGDVRSVGCTRARQRNVLRRYSVVPWARMTGEVAFVIYVCHTHEVVSLREGAAGLLRNRMVSAVSFCRPGILCVVAL